jgi:hypothetical protein
MNSNNINISKIETYLNSVFDNVISDNTIFGEILSKTTIPESWNDMVLIEIPNGVEDRDAYGVGTVLVWLYARPLSSGRKNVAVMSKMETKLNEVLANNKDKTYRMARRGTYTAYDENIDWHCNVVEVVLKIY